MHQTFALALAAMAALAPSALAQAERTVVFGYTVSFQCPEVVASDQPGSSRNNPIVLEDFGEAFWDAHKDEADFWAASRNGEASDISRFDCKWVQLSGYYGWDDRRGYRGTLTEAYRLRNIDDEAYYLIESLADDAPPRGSFAGRHVKVTGRFYDLCYHEQASAAAQNRVMLSMGGECHYGANRGMMLDDVSIDHVRDTKPVYLLGDFNRAIANDLLPARELEAPEIRSLVASWMILVRQGPEAVFEYAREHSDSIEEDENFYHDRIAGRHSYAAHLNNSAAFRQISLTAFKMRAFQINGENGEAAVACVCMQKSCTDKWPLFSSEAARFLGDAACVELIRERTEPWRLSLD